MATNSTPTVEAFEAAALPYLDELFRMAARVVGDRSDASDIVQEAYLQAWKSFHRFEPGTNCRAWLYKILFHTIYHHRRKQSKRRLHLVDEGERGLEETVASPPVVPEHLTDAGVIAAFDRLPEQYREVVMLVDVNDFSYKEAAAALDVPIGTVMSRLSRGRQILRKELAAYAATYGIGLAAESA